MSAYEVNAEHEAILDELLADLAAAEREDPELRAAMRRSISYRSAVFGHEMRNWCRPLADELRGLADRLSESMRRWRQ